VSPIENIEHLVASDVTETVWLRFSRLTSPTLCRRALAARLVGVDPDILDQKAKGVSSPVRSLLGYWQTPSANLNAAILTRYYALLQASVAEQVASADLSIDLTAVQKHTEFGHGFACLQADSLDTFPDSCHIACLKSGHFASYAKSRQLPVETFAFSVRPRHFEALTQDERGKLLTLSDLLLRIPELQIPASECLGRPALSFQVGHSDQNPPPSFFSHQDKPTPSGEETTFAALYVEPSSAVTSEWLNSLGLPILDIEATENEMLGRVERFFTGKLTHPRIGTWWDHFSHYKSDYCGTSVMVPFWGITDPFVLHLATLYGLSIVVRYLPSVWQRVEHGELDHIRALIENYIAIFDHIGPQLALERITGTKLVVATPGSFNAPV